MKRNLIFSLLALVALWLGWLVAYYIVRNDYVLPSVWETLSECGRLLIDGAFWRAFSGTILRTLLAFIFSVLLGVGLALLAVLFDKVRAFFAPIISVLRTVPTMAIVLILLLWTSPSVAPVIVSFLVLFPAVYAAALAAFDETKNAYNSMVRAYAVPRGRQVVKMYLPLGASSICSQLGGIASMGLKITVSGEVLSNTYKSLGGVMQEAKMFLQTPRLLALTVLVILIGFLLEGLFALIGKFVARRQS